MIKSFIAGLGIKRRELLAKTVADFTKAVFAIAVASGFFSQFGSWKRILLIIAIAAGVAAALAIEPKEKPHG